MLVAYVLAFKWLSISGLFIVSLFSFASLIIYVHKFIFELKPVGGYCNWITMIRFLLIGLFCVLHDTVGNNELWLVVLTVAICLDGLDGYLARKFNHESVFGSYFDMEVDAFFVLVMSFFYYKFQSIGVWILVPALLRYIYKLARIMVDNKQYVEPKSKVASYIAGYHFFVLLAAMLANGNLQFYLLVSGVSLVSISFLLSYYRFLTFEIKVIETDSNRLA